MDTWVLLAIVGAYLMFNAIKNYFSGSSQMPSPQQTERIASLIKSNPVFVASKASCPFCRNTLNTFKGLGVRPNVLDLESESEGGVLQKALINMTGQRTVPQVFIGGKFIGGNSELQQVEPSKLQQMLKEANAFEKNEKL